MDTRDDPIIDLAWCEWIVRVHHRELVDDLGCLFTGYGVQPSWRRRHDAMVAQCRRVVDFWQHHLQRDLGETDSEVSAMRPPTMVRMQDWTATALAAEERGDLDAAIAVPAAVAEC